MNATLKKIGVAALAALSIAGASIATSSSAEARWHGGGWHGGGWHGGGWHGGWRGGGWHGGWGPAFVGGLALGAFAASAPYYYGYPAYDYYGGCYLRRRVVGFTVHGNPIVRRVRVCY